MKFCSSLVGKNFRFVPKPAACVPPLYFNPSCNGEFFPTLLSELKFYNCRPPLVGSRETPRRRSPTQITRRASTRHGDLSPNASQALVRPRSLLFKSVYGLTASAGKTPVLCFAPAGFAYSSLAGKRPVLILEHHLPTSHPTRSHGVSLLEQSPEAPLSRLEELPSSGKSRVQRQDQKTACTLPAAQFCCGQQTRASDRSIPSGTPGDRCDPTRRGPESVNFVWSISIRNW